MMFTAPATHTAPHQIIGWATQDARYAIVLADSLTAALLTASLRPVVAIALTEDGCTVEVPAGAVQVDDGGVLVDGRVWGVDLDARQAHEFDVWAAEYAAANPFTYGD